MQYTNKEHDDNKLINLDLNFIFLNKLNNPNTGIVKIKETLRFKIGLVSNKETLIPNLKQPNAIR